MTAELGFVWGIKSTFIDYLRRLPDADVVVDAPAGLAPGHGYYFAWAGGSRDADDVLRLRFRGRLRFVAHRGLLSVVLRHPIVEIAPGAARLLVADDRSRDEEALRHLADLDLGAPSREGDVVMWSEVPVRLAEDGVEVFGESYQAGELLDALTFRISAAGMRDRSTAAVG